MLHLQDVVFRYQENGKRNVLNHVSLDIADGRITVLMGSSGCGKSTLAAVCTGLYPENGGYLEKGSIKWYDQEVREMKQGERAKYATVLFQNPDLQFCMDTLRHEMEFCMENLSIPAEQMEEQIEAMAQKMGLTHLMDQPLYQLSGGEKQKANLACLFLISSRCILMDEPFANIDETSALEIMEMMKVMHRSGISFLIIDHNLERWLPVADEIIVLGEEGKILARGIHQGNAEKYHTLLREQGLYLPQEEALPYPEEGGAKKAIALWDVSIDRKGNASQGRLWKKKGKGDANGDNLLVEHCSIAFAQGEMSAVLGASGSGKTTTLLSILKQHPYTGEIWIGDTPLGKIRKRDLYQKIGIVFQNPANQFITQNVEEEVIKSLSIAGKHRSEGEIRERADALLKEFGLDHYRRYSPYMLSQGQQRRLAVLSVIAGDQEILLLDEPTYGQDMRSAMTIMEQLKDRVAKKGLTVIFVTHEESLAVRYADRIYRLQEKAYVDVTAEVRSKERWRV